MSDSASTPQASVLTSRHERFIIWFQQQTVLIILFCFMFVFTSHNVFVHFGATWQFGILNIIAISALWGVSHVAWQPPPTHSDDFTLWTLAAIRSWTRSPRISSRLMTDSFISYLILLILASVVDGWRFGWDYTGLRSRANMENFPALCVMEYAALGVLIGLIVVPAGFDGRRQVLTGLLLLRTAQVCTMHPWDLLKMWCLLVLVPVATGYYFVQFSTSLGKWLWQENESLRRVAAENDELRRATSEALEHVGTVESMRRLELAQKVFHRKRKVAVKHAGAQQRAERKMLGSGLCLSLASSRLTGPHLGDVQESEYEYGPRAASPMLVGTLGPIRDEATSSEAD